MSPTAVGRWARLEDDAIGGFNAKLDKHCAAEGETVVLTALFGNEMEVLHECVAIGEVAPLTRADCRVSGCAALL